MENATLLTSWYSGDGNNSGSPNGVAHQAYEAAKVRFCTLLTQDEDKRVKVATFSSIGAVETIISEAAAKYTERRSHRRVRQWLSRLSSRIHHYGKIMDVMAQHHPEYVSLAWGAFKLLFVATQNHENTVTAVAKALSRIGDALPRVEFYIILYPTQRMKSAVEEIYALILRFFVRALEWYEESKLLHIIHSVTRPPELRYQDLLDGIEELSRRVDNLAMSASHAELREMHGKINAIKAKMEACETASLGRVMSKLEAHDALVLDMREKMIVYQTLNSSAAVDTNSRLADIQFSNIMSSISQTPISDPMKTYQYLQFMSKRDSRSARLSTVQAFWLSPRFKQWSSLAASDLGLIKGSFNTRLAVRTFCVKMVHQVLETQGIILWCLRDTRDEIQAGDISSADILKYLTLQALRAGPSSPTEKTMSLTCAQFHQFTTAEHWFGIFKSVLLRLARPVYIIIDLDILSHVYSKGEVRLWYEWFLDLFRELSALAVSTVVKVLLIGCGPIFMSADVGRTVLVNSIFSVKRARGVQVYKGKLAKGARFPIRTA